MTRTYALRRLLEHGSMTRPDLLECTRWTGRQLSHALDHVLRQGVVRRVRVPGCYLRSTAWRFEVVL